MKKLQLPILLFPLFILLFFVNPLKTQASWTKFPNNPVIPVGSSNTWDRNLVGSVSINYDGSIFRMWYEGNDGSSWRIGYATSSSGTTWLKNPNPVVDKIDNFKNFNVHDPKVILKDNIYKMWYAASNSPINSIHFNYTTSIDGITWTPSIIDLMPVSLTWEDDVISFPYTIFLNNRYEMWYAGRGNVNSINHWRLGHATSPDGLTWTKNPTPILWATEVWEGSDVANPSVIFDETTGIYEMFYHGDFGIGRATSTDGINWTKDPANPILTPGPTSFDSQRVFNPYVLKKDGVYYMWYTGIGSDGKWQIGLATSTDLPTILPTATPVITPSPTSTPTPSHTPSPTPTITSTPTPTITTPTITPTFTPSPTPTINQTASPIIIIPGLGASWNPKDIFSCSSETGGKWELAPYVNLYNRLMKTLTDNAHLRLNQDFYLYTYDWRQPLDKQAENFKTYLDNILTGKPAGTKIRLVGHSLGGLVIRSFLANNPQSHQVLSALTVGTPHLGTLSAYPIWEKGEIAIDDLLTQITISQVITNCKVARSLVFLRRSVPMIRFRTNREIVQYFVPVVKQLLPVFDYLRQDHHLKPVKQLKVQNDWVNNHPFPPNKYNVSFSTLSGDNNPTLRFFDVTNPTMRESVFGDWADGKPVGNQKVNSGDGTILDMSSQVDGAENLLIPGNHLEIIYSDAGISKILNFLGLASVPVAPATLVPEEISQNTLTISLSNDAQMKITDPRGNLIEAKENIFVSYNPSVGLYRVEILAGKTTDVYLHLSEITKNEVPNIQSISIQLTKNRPSRFYLLYNPLASSHLQLIPL